MYAALERRAIVPDQRPTAALFGPFVALLVFYTIAFPKGGIKFFGVPITIGYILTTLLLLLAMLRGRQFSITLDRIVAYLTCAMLGIWSAFVVRANGTNSAGFTIAYFTSVLYLPLFGLTLMSPLILDEHSSRIERALVWAVRFIVVYGIFLFLFKQFTGRWIEIPYLTVNAGDVGDLDDKYINRGGIFKLISTYNNGNIFGVSTLILAPLYLRLEDKRYFKAALYLALFLTLSRTVWIGILLVLVMRSLSRGLRPITILYLVLGVVIAVLGVSALLQVLGRDASFIFDRNLGGRAQQLNVLNDMRFIPQIQTEALPEIAYLGALKFFGIPGFLLFIAHLLVPSLLLWLEGTRVFATSRAAACLQGLLIYAVVAWSDAAFNYIPVMMVFWMVAGLGLWYAHDRLRGGRTARALAG